MELKDAAKKLLQLFAGNERNFGVFSPVLNAADESGKVRPAEVGWKSGPVKEEDWLLHLEGKTGMGIVPISDDQKVKFAAIDFDLGGMKVLGMDLVKLAARVEEARLPFIICRSKSGAAHFYVFFKAAVRADHVRDKLVEITDYLGLRVNGTPPEIYPHTGAISMDSNGKYINMPYFGGANSDRYGLAPDGGRMSLETFLHRVEYMATTGKAFFAWKPAETFSTRVREIVMKGPPCLQTLFEVGVDEGHRNIVMFQFSVLFKKAEPDNWREYLTYLNQHSFKPPLPQGELATVIQSIASKTYHYNCSAENFKCICAKNLCLQREHGVGSEVDFPPVKAIVQYGIGADNIEIYLESGRVLKINCDELLDFKIVRSRVLALTGIVLSLPKKGAWDRFLTMLMQRLEVRELAPSYHIDTQIKSLIVSFATRTLSERLEDLFLGRPVKTGEFVYIPHEAIQKMIRDKKFGEYKENDEYRVITAMNGTFEERELKGRHIAVIKLPALSVTQEEMVKALESNFETKY